MPGLMLALTLLPIARPLRAPDSRAWQTLIFLTVVYAITVLTTPRWYPGYIVGTIFLTLALVWAPAGLGLMRARGRGDAGARRDRRGGILLLAVVLGRAQEVQYYENHYTRVTPFLQEGGPQRGLHLRPRTSTTNGSGSPARARSTSASTGSTAPTSTTTSSTSGSRARAASTGSRPPAGSSAAGSTTANTTT